MFFFQRNIVKQISNSNGLYIRYIDDIFITINWPTQHLSKQIDRWNKFDVINIKLKGQVGYTTNFLDLKIENKSGVLFTEVYHKPSYELYYLPFNSIHPIHMKKNIPFEMLIRAIKYCSAFEAHLYEREKLRMALLLNKYPVPTTQNNLAEKRPITRKFLAKPLIISTGYPGTVDQIRITEDCVLQFSYASTSISKQQQPEVPLGIKIQ
ncbi:unnamed protein product [Rotaria magnacalcarata]|uniref:Helix-turn-helix domain-containing protein n=1 Tax=Rotaria magnacalcarata TaxID=392030 RepID=A0A820A9Q7_9BILA|nr:unnamed protein product [Rotaria magnacalcarata]CAF4236535.1 unnamed protein product [Rotaria magnacalcarata]